MCFILYSYENYKIKVCCIVRYLNQCTINTKLINIACSVRLIIQYTSVHRYMDSTSCQINVHNISKSPMAELHTLRLQETAHLSSNSVSVNSNMAPSDQSISTLLMAFFK